MVCDVALFCTSNKGRCQADLKLRQHVVPSHKSLFNSPSFFLLGDFIVFYPMYAIEPLRQDLRNETKIPNSSAAQLAVLANLQTCSHTERMREWHAPPVRHVVIARSCWQSSDDKPHRVRPKPQQRIQPQAYSDSHALRL